MKRTAIRVAAICMCAALLYPISGGRATAAGRPGTAPPGLDAMTATGWDDLASIQTQVVTGEFSSFDRHDANDDGFTGKGFYGTESNGDRTIASITGPGEITKLFFAGVWPADTRLKIYLDGATTPTVDQSFGYFFAGTHAPYLSPLVVPQIDSAGAYSSYLPITFSKGVKVAVTLSPSNPSGGSSVYGVDYQRYPAATRVATFDPTETDNPTEAAVDAIWNSTGADPKQAAADHGQSDTAVTGTVTVPSNGSATIFDGTGPAQVDAVKLTLPGGLGSAATEFAEDTLNNLGIRIFWDGESIPSVDAPLGSFFGTGLFGAAHPAEALPFGFDGTSFYMYFPMPYRHGARIQLYSNRAIDTPGVSFTVLSAPFRGSFDDVGYFHTQYHFTRARATDPFDYVALSAVGSGKYVGLETSGSGSPADSPYNDQAIHWMEGDAHIYVDGSQSPQWDGTGTEDYFGGAGYFCCGNGGLSYPANQGGFSYFTNPLNGFTAHEYPTSGYAYGMTGNMAMYRVQAQDGIDFHSSIVLSFEHGGGIRPVTPASGAVPLNPDFQNQNAEAWTLAFYYYQPAVTDQVTDTLEVGDPASESSHHYRADGSQPPTTETNSWEGDLDAVHATLSGRTLSGPSQFTLRVDPDNRGVTLRRTFDQSSGPMSADVYVDGRLVGPWSYPGTNSTFAWRDDDLTIPVAYTGDQSAITVRIVPTGTSPWNEFRYQALSIVAQQAAAQPEIPDGATGQISSLTSHLDLDAAGGGTAPGTGVVQTVSLGSADGQLWRAIALPQAHTYAFVDVNSGLVLAGRAGSQATTETWTGDPTQMWALRPAPTPGYYVLRNVGNSSAATSEVLDDTNASTTPGTAIQQYGENDSASQQWRFEDQDVPPTLFPVTTGIPDTPAPLQSGTVYTLTARVSGLHLDLRYGQPSSANQYVQEYTPNGSCAQGWLLTQVATNAYTLASTCASDPAGQDLVVQDQGLGQELQLEPLSGSAGSPAQQWRVELVKDGISDSYYRLVNVGDGNVLNVCNSGQPGCQGGSPGDPVQSYTWDGTTAALWRLQALDTPTCSTLPAGCGRWYELAPQTDPGVRLDDAGSSTVAGSPAEVVPADHTCAQEWRADYVVDGYYKLTSLCGDKVLGVTDSSTATGASVQIWGWNGTDAELWRIDPASTPGDVTLTSKAGGLVLSAGGSGVHLAAPQVADPGQQWHFQLEP